ncbi:YXWGXW repeat-containing protein [uncultured Fibrella sp.]|uniref:YXWGXW repeat-containing protein n=1 Tax=uncultured Fibrella sp. TaxID=1284596 RepID=UPI0035C9AA13
MKTLKVTSTALCCGFMLLGSLSSCVVRPVASRPAPPPQRVEVIPAPPRGRYVWSPGYHRYRRNGYVWVPGRYVRVR